MMNFDILHLEVDILMWINLTTGMLTADVYTELHHHHYYHSIQGKNKSCVLCKDFNKVWKILYPYIQKGHLTYGS